MGFFKNFATAFDVYSSGRQLGTDLGSAPSGYGAEYDSLFSANPYRNLTYKKTGFQDLLSALGFRTDYDRWREDAQVNANEYDAGIFSMMQQNDFNSPLSQADRMRQGGMNPDLLGIGDVASGAQPTEDPNGMNSNSGNEEFTNFGETIASVFSRAMAIFKDFKSLEQMSAVIDGQNIDNAVKMTGAIDEFIIGQLTTEDFLDYETYQDRISQLVSQNTDFESGMAKELGFSKRQFPQFNKLMHDRLLSISTDKKAYQMFKERIEALSGSKEAQTDPFSFANQGSAGPSGESAVDILVKGMVKAHKKALEYSAKATASMSAVSAQEAGNLELMNAGKASAQAQMSEYDSRKVVAQWNSECARIKKDMIRQLERSALAGDRLSKAMLMSWSLDDIARLSVSANASLGFNLGFSF